MFKCEYKKYFIGLKRWLYPFSFGYLVYLMVEMFSSYFGFKTFNYKVLPPNFFYEPAMYFILAAFLLAPFFHIKK